MDREEIEKVKEFIKIIIRNPFVKSTKDYIMVDDTICIDKDIWEAAEKFVKDQERS
jgi:hypothetical protein